MTSQYSNLVTIIGTKTVENIVHHTIWVTHEESVEVGPESYWH
jgi:hypothetical protein